MNDAFGSAHRAHASTAGVAEVLKKDSRKAVAGFLKGKKVPLGDGVDADDRKLMPAFPYVADPRSGFEDTKAS